MAMTTVSTVRNVHIRVEPISLAVRRWAAGRAARPATRGSPPASTWPMSLVSQSRSQMSSATPSAHTIAAPPTMPMSGRGLAYTPSRNGSRLAIRIATRMPANIAMPPEPGRRDRVHVAVADGRDGAPAQRAPAGQRRHQVRHRGGDEQDEQVDPHAGGSLHVGDLVELLEAERPGAHEAQGRARGVDDARGDLPRGVAARRGRPRRSRRAGRTRPGRSRRRASPCGSRWRPRAVPCGAAAPARSRGPAPAARPCRASPPGPTPATAGRAR